MSTGFRRALGAAALAAGLAVAAPGPAHAAPAAWVPCGDTAGLVAAIRAANEVGGGMIWLAPRCVYWLSAPAAADHGPDGLPVIGGRVWISGFRSTIARAVGSPFFRIAEIAPYASLTLSGVAVRGGVAAGPGDSGLGGGILNLGRLSTVAAQVVGNTAGYGGGVFDGGGNADLGTTAVVGNRAVVDGGGVYQYGGVLRVSGSSVDGNVAGRDGGGLAVVGGMARLDDSTADDNAAGGQGGGVRVENSSVRLDGSRVSDNASATDCFPEPEVPGCG
jgi:hypothetical protein